MAVKGLKDLVKRERERTFPVTPFYDVEKWFEDMWKRPFSLLTPSIFSDVDLRSELYGITPIVDIYEEDNFVVLKADLPGMKKEDIRIDLSENMLTISGEKTKTEKIEKGDYYRSERYFGTFHRRFELPGDLDTEKIIAHYDKGVLELRIPMLKEAEKKHKKISID
ncbi:MAG: Hsp20/alpha crystallin family protein [Nitrospiraceae bacterium]|nr:MAG: Hsp20/alpha crystallin family protein [Nitrospiraceae bacterium]